MNDKVLVLQETDNFYIYMADIGFAKNHGLIAITGKSGTVRYTAINLTTNERIEVPVFHCKEATYLQVTEIMETGSVARNKTYIELTGRNKEYMNIITRKIKYNKAVYSEVIISMN